MKDTEGKTGGLAPGAGGGAGTPASTEGGEQEVLTLTQAQLEQLIDKRVEPMLQQAEERGRRNMQSIKDREAADRTRQHREQLQALQGLSSSKIRDLGGGEPEIQAVRDAFEGQVTEQAREAELESLRRYAQEREGYDRAQRVTAELLSIAGVPTGHPALVLSGTEEEFYASVKKAKEQITASGGQEPPGPGEPRKPGEQATQPPSRTATGEAAVLGGGTGAVKKPNPIADRHDADGLIGEGMREPMKK